MYYILILAILILSWSAIIIRWVGDVNPILIAFYRLLFSTIILSPAVVYRKKISADFLKKNWKLLFTSGLFLSLHFYTWIASLQTTSVGHSIFLESTHPLFGWLLSVIFLKEKGNKYTIIGLLLGLSGMYLIVSENFLSEINSFKGDMLAVFSGFSFAVYLLMARKIGKKIEIFSYVFIIYGISAVILGGAAFLTHLDFTAISAKSWLFLLLLTIGPNLTGHTILNWISRKIEIYKVNFALLAEPVFSTILAVYIFNEVQGWNFLAGALLVLVSIFSVFEFQKE
jgi:drug/metabolite transporter (DMT)-like permease